MKAFDTSRSILQEIQLDSTEFKNIRLLIKRDDLIHPEVSGNKWRKLKYNIENAVFQKKEGLLTFGGAYSNHLLATASACHKLGLKSLGIVRGEELNSNSNQNLQRCSELGMELLFVTRTRYEMRNDKEEQERWKEQYPSYYLVPEGGANYYGLIGCQKIWKEIPENIDHVFVAQGTTNTSCGLLLGLPQSTTLHVVPVLKGFDSIVEMKKQLIPFVLDKMILNEYIQSVVIHPNHHFGGYGKSTDELNYFIKTCQESYQIPLDKVYTAKAFYSMLDWLKLTRFKKETTILFIHTGGLLNGEI